MTEQRYLVSSCYWVVCVTVQVPVAVLRSDLVGRHITKNGPEPLELLGLIGPRLRAAVLKHPLVPFWLTHVVPRAAADLIRDCRKTAS
jgi:hypothetical protein